MAMSSEFRSPVAAMRARSAVHRSGCVACDAPQVVLQLAGGGARLAERRMRAVPLGQVSGRLQGSQVDLLGDPGG